MFTQKRMHMKKFALLAFAGALALASCSSDDDNNPNPPGGGGDNPDTLKTSVTTSTTLKADKVHYLNGVVFVKNNATLTIEPGTIIKGIKGSKATLIVTKGAKLVAAGTVDKPIVFTSNQAANARAHGDWGGIVLVGKAKVNTTWNGVAGRRVVEGFSAADRDSYKDDIIGGGDDDSDNSGTLKYVRIEYGGIPLSTEANSELNGLTFVAVGSGTTIDHIQVSYSGDDSYEWFGGTVNAKYLVAFSGVDDDFDTDNGFRGKVQFGVSIRNKDLSDVTNASGASNGFESDNEENPPATPSSPNTAPVFSNMTILGPGVIGDGTLPAGHVFKRGAHIRRASQLSLYNSVIAGFPTGLLLDGDQTVKYTIAGTQAVKNTFVGMAASKKLDAVVTAAVTFDVTAWFNTAAFANNVSLNTAADLKLTNLTSLTAIDPKPQAGSPLLNKAAFADTKVADAFFTKVTYVGAFAEGDTWLATWTNFNPNAAAY